VEMRGEGDEVGLKDGEGVRAKGRGGEKRMS